MGILQLDILKTLLLLMLGHLILASENTTASSDASCQFPQSLTSKSKWETEIRQEKRKTGMFVRFTANTIIVTDFEGVRPTQKTYDVQKCFESQKYLARLKDEESYVCFAIKQMSHYILKWSISESLDYLTDELCNDENLEPSKWPLIWPYYQKAHHEACPLKGGFNMKIYDNTNEKYLCENYWLSPRVDSECMIGEGMSFQFRHFECMGNLGMKMIQEVACLGTYEENGYSYTVLSNGDKLWPKLWLMRLSSSYNTQLDFDMEIFQDIQEEAGDEDSNGKSYTFSLTKKVIESICEDEGSSAMCSIDTSEVCDDLQQMYCKKSCGMCETTEKTCTFEETLKGVWETVEPSGHKTQASIGNTYTVTTKNDVVQFLCMNTSRDQQLQTTNKYPLMASFDNGCRPRFSCLEIIAKSNSVMKSRMSKKTIWPQSVDVSVMCSENNFNEDQSLTESPVTSKHPHVMIKTEMENGEGRAGDCEVELETYYLKPESDESSWTIISMLNKTYFRNNTCVNVTGDIHGEEHYWQCLAYFQEGATEYLVVESLTVNMFPRSQCWISYNNERLSSRKLLVVFPYDCNDAAVKYNANDHTRLLSDYMFTNDMNSGPPCTVTNKPTTTYSSAEDDEPLGLVSTKRPESTEDVHDNLARASTIRYTTSEKTTKNDATQDKPVTSSENWKKPDTSLITEHFSPTVNITDVFNLTASGGPSVSDACRLFHTLNLPGLLIIFLWYTQNVLDMQM